MSKTASPRTYGLAVSRAARAKPALHIAETVPGARRTARDQRWIETRHGAALCGVLVQHFPEPGAIADATCPRCIRKYRKITEADQ